LKQVILIAAAAENNALGKDNKMLWRLPDDFKRFKQLTMGHAMIMGRKTFESLPGILQGRLHIIVSRHRYDAHESCLVAHSIEEAVAMAPGDTVSVIGGGEIYKLAMPLATRIELTRVHTILPADAFFPEIDTNIWTLQNSEFHDKDEKHTFSFAFETWVRKNAID
jgi:dihydrofolate reductase